MNRVRTLTGKEIELDIEMDYKVGGRRPFSGGSRSDQGCRVQVSQIKEKVEEKEGIPPVQQRLIHGGKQMYEFPRVARHLGKEGRGCRRGAKGLM